MSTSGYKLTADQLDQLGNLADTCDNFVGASRIPLADAVHVPQLRAGLQAIAADLRKLYIAISGFDPWHEGPGGED